MKNSALFIIAIPNCLLFRNRVLPNENYFWHKYFGYNHWCEFMCNFILQKCWCRPAWLMNGVVKCADECNNSHSRLWCICLWKPFLQWDPFRCYSILENLEPTDSCLVLKKFGAVVAEMFWPWKVVFGKLGCYKVM